MIFIGFGSVFSILHISELLLSEQPFFSWSCTTETFAYILTTINAFQLKLWRIGAITALPKETNRDDPVTQRADHREDSVRVPVVALLLQKTETCGFES